MKSYFKAIGLIIILLFLVTFGIKNHQFVQLNYYFDYRSADFPLYLLAYGCATIGIFIGMLIGIINRFHQRKKIKMLTKLNNELKAKAEKEKKEEEETPAVPKPATAAAEEKISEDKTPEDEQKTPEKTPADRDAAKKGEDTQRLS